jgi:antitoxin component YwqK of YwqJK toxin-antitoxin module
MHSKKWQYAIPLTWLIILLAGCQRGNDPAPTTGNCVPTKLESYQQGKLDQRILTEYDSRQNLKKREEWYYDIPTNRLAYFKRTLVEFDPQGLATIEKMYQGASEQNPALISETVYEHNGAGQVIQKEVRDMPSGNVSQRITYVYHGNGKLQLETTFNNSNQPISWKEYDDTGRIIRREDSNVKMIVSFDGRGNETGYSFTVNGKLTESMEKEFDAAGLLLKSKETKAVSQDPCCIYSYREATYTYSNSKLMRQEVKTTYSDSPNQTVMMSNYEYDANGFLKKIVHLTDNQPLFTDEISTDSQGREISRKTYNTDPSRYDLITYRYYPSGKMESWTRTNSYDKYQYINQFNEAGQLLLSLNINPDGTENFKSIAEFSCR